MSVEEIRSRIEEEVSRRLAQHFGELREEFDALHRENERRWQALVSRLGGQLPELVPAHLIPEPAPPAPPVPTALDYSEARGFARSIDGAGNQVETLKSFLGACASQADRVILLVAKGEVFVVWKAEGFSPSEEARIRTLQISPASSPELDAVLQGSPTSLPAGNGVSRTLGAGDAQAAVLFPIVVHEKISAVLYADRFTDHVPFDPEAIGLLAFLVGVSIDRLVTRKISPAPALKPLESVSAEPSPEPYEPAATRAIPTVVPTVEPPPPAPPSPTPAPAVREMPAAAPPPPAAGRRFDLEGTGKPYQPPPGVSGGAAARILRGPLGGGEEDPHDQAKRIARLLVSDIKLYNESAISEGKKHNDLYSRLKDDIDRALQTYNERVPATVRQTTNYFQEELVRSIADGRPEALGV